MRETPECTVIVPTHNRQALLRWTLHSLTLQDLAPERFEVMVVDDGVDDGTPALVDHFASRLNLVHHRLPDEGFWVSRVRNVGIRNAAGDVCVFADSGTMLHSGCLSAHLACHRAGAPAAAVIGYVYGYRIDDRYAEQIRAAIDVHDPDATIETFRRDGDWPDVREDFYARYTDDIGDLPAPWLVYWTVNASARTDLLKQVGMFDEEFRSWGGEDLDLGYRLHRAGARITLCRRASALHLPHAKDFDANMRSVAPNYEYMANKYGGRVFELLTTEPPDKFFALNDMLRDSAPVEA